MTTGLDGDIVKRVAECDAENLPDNICWQSQIILPEGLGDGTDKS